MVYKFLIILGSLLQIWFQPYFCASDFYKNTMNLIISYGDIVYEEKILEALLDSDAELSVVLLTNLGETLEVKDE